MIIFPGFPGNCMFPVCASPAKTLQIIVVLIVPQVVCVCVLFLLYSCSPPPPQHTFLLFHFLRVYLFIMSMLFRVRVAWQHALKSRAGQFPQYLTSSLRSKSSDGAWRVGTCHTLTGQRQRQLQVQVQLPQRQVSTLAQASTSVHSIQPLSKSAVAACNSAFATTHCHTNISTSIPLPMQMHRHIHKRTSTKLSQQHRPRHETGVFMAHHHQNRLIRECDGIERMVDREHRLPDAVDRFRQRVIPMLRKEAPAVRVTTWNRMLKTFGEAGATDIMTELFFDMNSHGVSYDSTTFTTVIYHAGRMREHARMVEMFEKMQQQFPGGQIPSFHCAWSAVLSGFARCGKMDMVLSYFEKWRSAKRWSIAEYTEFSRLHSTAPDTTGSAAEHGLADTVSSDPDAASDADTASTNPGSTSLMEETLPGWVGRRPSATSSTVTDKNVSVGAKDIASDQRVAAVRSLDGQGWGGRNEEQNMRVIDNFTWNAVLNALGQHGYIDEMWAIYKMMQTQPNAQERPDQVTVNIVVNCCAMCMRLDLLFIALAEARIQELLFTARQRESLKLASRHSVQNNDVLPIDELLGIQRAQDPETGEWLWQLSEAKLRDLFQIEPTEYLGSDTRVYRKYWGNPYGIHTTVVAWTSMLNALTQTSRSHMTLQLINKVKGTGLDIFDSFGWNAYLHALACCEQYDDMARALEEMKHTDVAVLDIHYCTVMNAFTRAGLHSEAHRVFEEALLDTTLHRTEGIWVNYLQNLGLEGKYHEMTKALEHLNRHGDTVHNPEAPTTATRLSFRAARGSGRPRHPQSASDPDADETDAKLSGSDQDTAAGADAENTAATTTAAAAAAAATTTTTTATTSGIKPDDAHKKKRRLSAAFTLRPSARSWNTVLAALGPDCHTRMAESLFCQIAPMDSSGRYDIRSPRNVAAGDMPRPTARTLCIMIAQLGVNLRGSSLWLGRKFYRIACAVGFGKTNSVLKAWMIVCSHHKAHDELVAVWDQFTSFRSWVKSGSAPDRLKARQAGRLAAEVYEALILGFTRTGDFARTLEVLELLQQDWGCSSSEFEIHPTKQAEYAVTAHTLSSLLMFVEACANHPTNKNVASIAAKQLTDLNSAITLHADSSKSVIRRVKSNIRKNDRTGLANSTSDNIVTRVKHEVTNFVHTGDRHAAVMMDFMRDIRAHYPQQMADIADTAWKLQQILTVDIAACATAYAAKQSKAQGADYLPERSTGMQMRSVRKKSKFHKSHANHGGRRPSPRSRSSGPPRT
jgi:pentatricopeptide repeat protein